MATALSLKVRKGYGYEGEVIYFIDEYGNVIGILKKKTVWYIILRAIREKLRNHMSPRSTDDLAKLLSRVGSHLFGRESTDLTNQS